MNEELLVSAQVLFCSRARAQHTYDAAAPASNLEKLGKRQTVSALPVRLWRMSSLQAALVSTACWALRWGSLFS